MWIAKIYFHYNHMRKKMVCHSPNHFILTILELVHVVSFHWISSFPFLPFLPTYSLRVSLIIISTVNLLWHPWQSLSLCSCSSDHTFTRLFYPVLLNANKVIIYLWICLSHETVCFCGSLQRWPLFWCACPGLVLSHIEPWLVGICQWYAVASSYQLSRASCAHLFPILWSVMSRW